MDARIENYLTNADRFAEVVGSADRWDGQSPCEEWTAADVLTHVLDTQRDFLGKRGADLGDLPPAPPASRWATHLDQVRGVVADEGFATEEYDGYFGRTSVADTLANFYGFDMVVHRWDLARAVGADATWTEEEMDALEANLDSLGDNLYTQGVCKPPLAVDDGAPRQERLLARLGRRA